MITSYFTLDTREAYTEEEWISLSEILKPYFIHYGEVSTVKGRTLFFAVLRHGKMIEDQVTELEDGSVNTKPGLLTLFSARNPAILGCWNIDGTQVGTSRVHAVYDEEGVVLEEAHIVGDPIYPFNSKVYIPFMPDIVDFDKVTDEEISRTRPTKAAGLNNYSKFEPQVMS